MNIGAWFANMIIDFFGFSSELAMGSAGFAGVMLMLALLVAFASAIVILAMRFGWIDGDKL